MNIVLNGTQLYIQMPDTVNYNCNIDCLNGIRSFVARESGFEGVTLDFRYTKYIDSSGLGMLLMFRDIVRKKPIKFINVGPEVLKVITIANFQRLFKIEK